MIGYLKGNAEIIGKDYVIIECSNIGFKVFMATSDISLISVDSKNVTVYTNMYVREDIMTLYGFLNQEDLLLFELLIGVSGIGPKVALSLLSTMSGNDVKFAILSDDVTSISKAPGLGKKTAQKLILELKDKLNLDNVFEERYESTNMNTASSLSDDYMMAVEALVSLGYTPTEAKSALSKCTNQNADAEILIKEALRHLF